MHINKGYIVPVILILLLLVLAGFFIFTQEVVESPVVEVGKPILSEEIDNVTSTEDSFIGTSTGEIINEEISTSSATTTVFSSGLQNENE